MNANSDPSRKIREHSGLPLSADPWESRGGSVWVVAGMCALALAVVFHLQLDPVAARERNGADADADADHDEQPAARRERATPQPAAPAPAAPEAVVGAKTAVAGPSASMVPSADEQNPKPARRSKRASAELQRLRRALTDEANRGTPAAQEAAAAVDSPALPALDERAEAATLEEAPPPAAPSAPARASAIPDNPY